MKKKDIVRKNVVFNLEDPDQRELLKHAETRPNFSGYVKRLIQRDMEGGQTKSAPPAIEPYEEDELDITGSVEDML